MIYFFYSISVFRKPDLFTPILLKSGVYPVRINLCEPYDVDDVFDEINSQIVEWLETTLNVDADDYIIHFKQFNKV